MTTKNILFNNCKELISLFLTTGDKFSWPKEIAISKKLLKLWPELDFWRNYDPNTRFHSLSVFLTKSGKKEIQKNYELYLLTKPPAPIILEENPIVILEESKINKRSKTLQEFVDNIL